MLITEDELRQFIEAYEQEFGKELPREQALEMATRLLSLYRVIMRPLPPEIEDEIRRRCEDRVGCETSLGDV